MKNYLALLIMSYLLIACKPQNDTNIVIEPTKIDVPELGEYISFSIVGGLDYNYQYNIVNNVWEWKWRPNIQLSPSPLGKLRFNANGSYDFIDLNKTGTYKYNESTKLISFTGFLEGADGRYRVQRGVCLLIIVSKDGNTIQYEKNASLPQPDLKTPNSLFKGTILTSLAYNTMQYIDVSTAKVLKSHNVNLTALGVSGLASVSVNIYKNNPLDYDEIYPNLEIKDTEGNTLVKYKGVSTTGKKWAIGEYWYGVPSPDGSKIALAGKYMLHSSLLDPNYRAPFPIISIIDAKTGNEITWIECDNNNSWTADWLPNGGLILPKKGGGISLTDASFNIISAIYTKSVNEARSSPNGKKVAFAEGGKIFTMNIDGTNIQELTNKKITISATNLMDMCWSPDNESIAFVKKNLPLSDYFIYFASLDGEQFSYFNDIKGDYYLIKSHFISWK
jgi:hypothetical protein